MADEVRLIDAGELIGYLHEKTFIDGDDRSMVYKAIEEQPTIETEPVKHGRWTLCDDGYIRCSECKSKAFIDNDETIATDFCHSCGAKMDLKDGDSDDQK